MDTSKPLFGRSHEITEQLRQDILTGRIKEGARITEAELTKRFGLGRGPVREAVQRLAMQGLLETKPNCGAIVASAASTDILPVLIPIRRTLECHALKSIFQDLTTDDFSYWEGILEAMKDACQRGDHHAIAENDILFHRYLMSRLDQPDLLVIWDLLSSRMRTHFRQTQQSFSESLLDIYDEHKKLVEAFRGQSLDQAIQLLSEKID